MLGLSELRSGRQYPPGSSQQTQGITVIALRRARSAHPLHEGGVLSALVSANAAAPPLPPQRADAAPASPGRHDRRTRVR